MGNNGSMGSYGILSGSHQGSLTDLSLFSSPSMPNISLGRPHMPHHAAPVRQKFLYKFYSEENKNIFALIFLDERFRGCCTCSGCCGPPGSSINRSIIIRSITLLSNFASDRSGTASRSSCTTAGTGAASSATTNHRYTGNLAILKRYFKNVTLFFSCRSLIII